MLSLCSVSLVQARTFDLHGTFELDADLQLDYLDSGYADISSGFEARHLILNGSFTHYAGSNWLIYADLELDLAEEQRNNNENSSNLDDNDDVVGQFIFGLNYNQHELSFGKHSSNAAAFSPVSTNYLSVSLSGFNDDRLDWFNYEVEDSLYVSSSTNFNTFFGRVNRSDINVTFGTGAGLTKSENSTLSLDYDFLIESTVPYFESTVLSIAGRSLTDPNTNNDFEAHGVKLNVFTNSGGDFSLELTENNFGHYLEFVYSHVFKYQFKLSLGVSDFNAEPDAKDLPNSEPINDATFGFVGLTYAHSDVIHCFGEFSVFDDVSDAATENILVGLKMLFE